MRPGEHELEIPYYNFDGSNELCISGVERLFSANATLNRVEETRILRKLYES